jgi:hypothetical protein
MERTILMAGYREGGSFTHNGKEYDLDKAFALADKKKVRNMSVNRLKWVLKYDKPNNRRLKAADISAPILVAPDKRGRPTVIDGLHRLAKASAAGVSRLPVRYLSKSDMTKLSQEKTILMNVHEYLEKIAAKKKPRTRAEIVAAWDRIEPNTAIGSGLYEDESLAELKRGYRYELKDQLEQGKDVPFEERVKNYKHYKKTGKLMPLGHYAGEHFVDDVGTEVPWSNSKKPVTIYHGGGGRNIKEALKSPGTKSHSTYLIPGETKATSRGMFFAPEKKNAEAYASMGRSFGNDAAAKGSPSLLSTTLPRRKMLGNTKMTEVFVGPKSLKKAKNVISRILR